MNTEELKNLGLTDEQAKAVFALHGKDIKAEQDKSKAEFDTQLKDLNTQIQSRDKDIKALKATADEETQAKIAEMQEKHKAELKTANDNLAKVKLDSKISEVLGQSKARNVELLRKTLNVDEISLNSDGELIGLNEQLSKLQETDAYLFQSAEPEKPTPKFFPNGNPSPTGSGDKSMVDKIQERLVGN